MSRSESKTKFLVTAFIGPVIATFTFDEWATFRWALFFPGTLIYLFIIFLVLADLFCTRVAVGLFIGASLLHLVQVPSNSKHFDHNSTSTASHAHHFEETNFEHGVLHHHYNEDKYAQS